MAVMETGADVNLQEIRRRLVDSVGDVLVGAAGLIMLLLLIRWPFPLVTFGLLGGVLGLGWTSRRLADRHPTLVRHTLVWGLTATLLAALWLFDHVWIPFLVLPLMFINTLLVGGGGFLTGAVVLAAALGLALAGARPYPPVQLLAVIAVGAALAWIVVRTLYTALDWALTMQQRADKLLEAARDRQGELWRISKSLETTNGILQRTRRELITARRQAETARRMKEQFAANVSHELRTPLNLILGFSEVMALSSEVYGDFEWPAALRQDIYQIYTSSRHLLDMINDVLDLSRFEMVGFTLRKEPTAVGDLIREAVDMARHLFRGRPVQLDLAIEASLPRVEIDRTRIRQVVLNLLKNAAHFTEQGQVTVGATLTGGEFVVSVKDSGPGIPEEEQARIFDEFYQIDRSLHRRHQGAGLGLAISRRFVEAHDGRVWVESVAGQGATFFFTLPADDHVPFSRLGADEPLEIAQPGARPPILVVDPDPAVANLVSRYVEGYEVAHADGIDALAACVDQHHPHGVLINVPPGDDPPATGWLSASVPVVHCSLPSQAWVATGLGVSACLTKPIVAEQLLRALKRLGDVQDVLIVDDDWGFCQMVERILEAADGHVRLRKAYDGTTGLQAVRIQRPDVLLLDLIMPGVEVDGFGVLEAVHHDPALSDLPIIVVTASGYAEDLLRRRNSRITVERPDGLNTVEVLGCLRAIFGALSPRYDERSAPELLEPKYYL